MNFHNHHYTIHRLLYSGVEESMHYPIRTHMSKIISILLSLIIILSTILISFLILCWQRLVHPDKVTDDRRTEGRTDGRTDGQCYFETWSYCG